MYGKAYESMYEGSMVGAGMNVFAVWNYIISKNREGYVEVNPKLLAFTLGGTPKEVESALEFLQQPDPISRSKLNDGKRLLKEGQFQYFVVNWEYYHRIKNEEDRREYNRIKQAEYRRKEKLKSGPSPNEGQFVKALEAGASDETLDKMSAPEERKPLD